MKCLEFILENVIVENVDKSLMNVAKELCENKIVKESTDFAKG